MPDELRLIVAFGLAFGAAFAITPVAIAVAARTDFHDKPIGYKGHSAPTPYLGGAAVLGGFMLAAVLIGGDASRLWPILGCALGLWVLGTVDDRVALPPWPRMAVEAVFAIILWTAGLGWDVFAFDAANLALTIVWVVGLINAFNLMDNMDGAAATVAGVTGVACGVLAVIDGDAGLAILAFGLAGACFGFLPYNLSAPARIFLGDGGSLPIGFIVAAVLMALLDHSSRGMGELFAGILLAGLPIVDTALVTISRRRVGLSVFTAGRDHLTHRLRSRLGSARTVAAALAVVQAGLGAVAIGAVQLGRGSVLVAWLFWFLVATATIALLESASWAPARDLPAAGQEAGPPRSRRQPATSPVEALVIAFIAISCGLSPFSYGFYDASVWGPIALGMLAVLLGLVIGRPAAPRRGAIVAALALAALWAWALVSSSWAESADQALTDANRWLLYAAMFAVLIQLLRDDRVARVVLGAGTVAVLGLAAYLLVRLCGGTAGELFLSGRLNEPLGYINGQAAYLLLAFWPLVAVAERARSWPLAGVAAGGAVALGALSVLSQTRAVLPAVAVSAVALMLIVPGRLRRAWVLVTVAGGVLLCLGPTLEVYDSVRGGRPPSDAVLRAAGGAIALASAAAGAAWGLAAFATPRLQARPGRAPGLQRLAWAPLVVLVAVGLATLVMTTSDPAHKVTAEYRAFVGLKHDARGSSRLTSGGGNRYDYWRVAWGQFESHPLVGVGAGNYDRTYFAERRTAEDIRQPHSVELQTLSELGVVGLILLGIFVAGVLFGLARRARAARTDVRQRALAVAAGGTFLIWLVHTSVDWLHLIPGLTGLALCSAVVLIGPWEATRRTLKRPAELLLVASIAAAVAAGGTLISRAALADRYREQGQDLLVRDPAGALARARSSLSLNDEALPSYYLEAAARARLDDYTGARAALVEAARREPHDFVPWALLGDLATRRGASEQASTDYVKASRLNPRDGGLAQTAQAARGRVAAR